MNFKRLLKLTPEAAYEWLKENEKRYQLVELRTSAGAAFHCETCDEVLTALSSLQIRKCTGCGREYEWKLKKGQLPLVKATR